MSSRYISEILHPKIDHSQHNYLSKLVKKSLFWAVFIIHAVSLSTVLRLFRFGWAHSWYNKTIYTAESVARNWAGVVMQKLPRKCKKKCVTDWPINGPTNGSTNGPTNQQTDRVEYRVTCMWLKYFSLQKWSRCSELQQKPLRRIQVRKNTGFSCKLWEINYLPWFFPSYHLKMPIKLDLQQDFNPMLTSSVP